MSAHECASSAWVNPGAAKHSKEPRRNETVLEIGADAIPDQAIQGLLDELFAPLIVERLIERLTKPR